MSDEKQPGLPDPAEPQPEVGKVPERGPQLESGSETKVVATPPQQVSVNAHAMIETLKRQRDRALNDSAIWEAKANDLQRILSSVTATPTETSTEVGGPLQVVEEPKDPQGRDICDEEN